MEKKERCKLSIRVFPPRIDYEGTSPFKDTSKLILPFVAVAGLYYFFRNKGKHDRKREFNPGSSDKPKQDTQEPPSPQQSFEVETLNEACHKSHTDVSELQMCGELLSKGDTMILFSPDGEGKSTLAAGMCIDIASGAKTKLLPESMVLHENKQEYVLWLD